MSDPHFRNKTQCATCPWRRAVDPTALGEGLGHVVPEKVIEQCKSGVESLVASKAQSCHRAPGGEPYACVGWVMNGLGIGNNLRLRIRAMRGDFDPREMKLLGEQRESVRELVEDAGGEE